MPQDGVFFTVERNLAGAFAHIAVVGIGHFSGAVDNAAHDGNHHILEAGSSGLYLVKGVFQVVQRAAAARTGNVLRFVETAPAGL